MKQIAIAVSLAFLMYAPASLSAQDKPPAPDNTKVNKQARPTADQAGGSAADRELMQKIRQGVMDDKSLSTYARNVKIIAKDGKVTLKGPVYTEAEKNAISKIATDVAGAGNVTDEITIKPSNKKKTS
jgi:hyperosmotically inducible periplasmic protein